MPFQVSRFRNTVARLRTACRPSVSESRYFWPCQGTPNSQGDHFCGRACLRVGPLPLPISAWKENDRRKSKNNLRGIAIYRARAAINRRLRDIGTPNGPTRSRSDEVRPQPVAASLQPRLANTRGMPIKMIKHEAVPYCGGVQVGFRTADRAGRPVDVDQWGWSLRLATARPPTSTPPPFPSYFIPLYLHPAMELELLLLKRTLEGQTVALSGQRHSSPIKLIFNLAGISIGRTIRAGGSGRNSSPVKRPSIRRRRSQEKSATNCPDAGPRLNSHSR